MKKLLVVVMILVLSVSFAFAWDLGLRGGINPAVSGRFLNEDAKGIELLGSLVSNVNSVGFLATGLYEIHKPVGEVENLTWFFGGGAHVGLGLTVVGSPFALGLDGIVGIEYSFESLIKLPLSLSFDYKPGFDILGGWTNAWFDTAFTLRYSF